MRWIYISPHLDDAVLSAGGLIFEQTRAGLPVEIWTFMCGFPADAELSPFAQGLHQDWGMSSAEEVVRNRRLEDLHAARLIGAKSVHFNLLDCIYRRGKNGDWLYSEVFVPPHEEDEHVARQVAETISAHLRPDDTLVCQLTIGSHVDHVLVRRGVERLVMPLFFYADIPYLFYLPDELKSKTVGMKSTAYPVSEAGLEAWQTAIAAYESQVEMLFGSLEAMREKISSYQGVNGGGRLWSLE